MAPHQLRLICATTPSEVLALKPAEDATYNTVLGAHYQFNTSNFCFDALI
jgi:hypothetical protein